MRAMNLPETRDEQIAWIESEMIGTELPKLATELQAIHNSPTEAWSIDQWPTETRDAVRENGLAALDTAQFSQLLTQPLRLLSVQRDVLENGSDYWNSVPVPRDLMIDGRLNVTRAVLSSDNTTAKASTPSNSFWSGATWAVVGALATAAMFLLIWRPDLGNPNNNVAQVPPETGIEDPIAAPDLPGWGFEKFAARLDSPDSDLAKAGRETYLNELAAAADTWSKKKPATPQALAVRIGEFRMGCSAILLASHKQLPESDRQWLRTRCQSWANALDQHLAAIESGQDVDEVRKQVDSTATKISAALIGRAETPA